MSLEDSFMGSKSVKGHRDVGRYGYSATELASFMQKSNKAASNLDAEAIKKKSGNVQVRGDKVIGRSGFQGAFTKMADEEVAKIINVFEKRKELIKTRKAAPGSSQTRLMGN